MRNNNGLRQRRFARRNVRTRPHADIHGNEGCGYFEAAG